MSASLLGHLLRPLVAPPVFDFWAGHVNRSWAWERTLARVVSRRLEARDTVSLMLKPNRRFAGFRPGQHVNVTVEVDGIRQTRSYSLTNVPGSDRRLSLTIKAIPGGRVSQFLCHQLGVGDILELSPAFGDFELPERCDGPWLFIAAGSGVTPIISMIRALDQRPAATDITLLYWARTRADLCFLAELEALALRRPGFRLLPVLTREETLRVGETSGRPTAELLEALVPDRERRHTYACGPAGFVARVEQLIGDQVAGFQSEAFTPPTFDPRRAGTVQITLTQQGVTLDLPTGIPLLSALEAAGVRPAHGCRMGICNSCVCAKRDGTTEDLRDGRLQHDAQAALKLCVSAARTDLTLDL